MIKALVAIEPDLSASLALRYICQLASYGEMEIQAIHVHEPEIPDHATGIGWTRRTWEKTMVEQCKKAIEPLLIAESRFCPVPLNSMVVFGDREKEILDRLEHEGYDLFVEGSAGTEAEVVEKKLASRLYQRSPAPILLVRNLFPIEKALLALSDGAALPKVTSLFGRLTKPGAIRVDVISLDFLAGSGVAENLVREQLTSQGYQPGSIRRVASEQELSLPADYGLVVVGIARGSERNRPFVHFLGRVPSALLFCWH